VASLFLSLERAVHASTSGILATINGSHCHAEHSLLAPTDTPSCLDHRGSSARSSPLPVRELAEDAVARSCHDIGERYAFVMAGWNGSTNSIDDTLRQRLVDAVQLAFARAPGVEGGIWQADAGSLAYAFPTYEGTGPKTDLPEAERASIRQVNGDVARCERPLPRRLGAPSAPSGH
jgi:hypothetical protein